jgi:hypothetical protein
VKTMASASSIDAPTEVASLDRAIMGLAMTDDDKLGSRAAKLLVPLLSRVSDDPASQVRAKVRGSWHDGARCCLWRVFWPLCSTRSNPDRPTRCQRDMNGHFTDLRPQYQRCHLVRV